MSSNPIGYSPAKKGSTRVFIIEGGARPDHVPVYQNCWRPGAVAAPSGDVTDIECPSPTEYNKWVKVGEFAGEKGRRTTDVQGRFPLDAASEMMRMNEQGCNFDMQYHLGECTDPRVFNTFTKAVIWEEARFTNYEADELGGLASGDNAAVNETGSISARTMYEALPISIGPRGDDVVVNPIVDVVICDNPSCGDCEDFSDGCEDIFAVDNGTTGSPGTAPDVVFSLDKGVTWDAEDVNTLGNGEPATGIACFGDYVVVISNVDNALHYKLKSTIGDGTTWTRQATGFVVTGEPNDIWSVGDYAFIVGDAGYVYGTDDPTLGVTVLDAGVATTQVLNAVHALDRYFAVAVGVADAVIFTTNGVTWQAAPADPNSAGALTAVWCKSETEWWVGANAGTRLYYTLDAGVTWTGVTLPGTGWTTVQDIQFPTKSIGYLVADKSATPKGFILESFNGGYSWLVLPQSGGVLTANDSLVAIATCEFDPNFVVAVGTADNATDGIILVGED